MNNVNKEGLNIETNNLTPWFPLAALMLMSTSNNSDMKELVDAITQNKDGSFNTDEFQKWLTSKMDELIKQNGSDLNKWIEQIKAEYPGDLPE